MSRSEVARQRRETQRMRRETRRSNGEIDTDTKTLQQKSPRFGQRALRQDRISNSQISIHNSPITSPIVANRFHGTTTHRFLAKYLLFCRFRLLANEGVIVFVGPDEVVRSCIAAHVTIDTRRVHIPGTRHVLFHFIRLIGQLLFTPNQNISQGRSLPSFRKY
jgi:hypothetical protein